MVARVTLGDGDAFAVLELIPDPDRQRRALVHAGGHAISHVGPLPPSLRAAVLAVVRGFAEATPTRTSTAALAQALAARATGLTATVAARLAPVVWPSWLRSGRPALRDRLDLWPFDGERAALALGRRRLLKRECFSDADEARDRQWLGDHGLTCARIGAVAADGRRTVLAATDRAAVEAYAAIERAATDHDRAAIAALGEALGYPRCCVEAWLARGGHDDASVWTAAGDDPTPRDPLALWLTPPLSLVSHVPCRPTCAATIELAAAVLAWLDDDVPGFAAAWRALAARQQVVDADGVAWAVTGAGDLTTGLTVDDAVGFPPPRGPGPVARAAPERRGARLTRADVVAAADHRAPA
jgi:hypothetical protein